MCIALGRHFLLMGVGSDAPLRSPVGESNAPAVVGWWPAEAAARQRLVDGAHTLALIGRSRRSDDPTCGDVGVQPRPCARELAAWLRNKPQSDGRRLSPRDTKLDLRLM